MKIKESLLRQEKEFSDFQKRVLKSLSILNKIDENKINESSYLELFNNQVHIFLYNKKTNSSLFILIGKNNTVEMECNGFYYYLDQIFTDYKRELLLDKITNTVESALMGKYLCCDYLYNEQ